MGERRFLQSLCGSAALWRLQKHRERRQRFGPYRESSRVSMRDLKLLYAAIRLHTDVAGYSFLQNCKVTINSITLNLWGGCVV